MTAYSVIGADVTAMAIKAGIYEVRIIQVVTSSISLGAKVLVTARYDTGNITGAGTAANIRSLRGGAPAASATARTGVIPSGTGQVLERYYLAPGGTATINPTFIAYSYSPTSAQYQPPATTVIAPGGVFSLQGVGADVVSTIFFEEIHLPGST